MDTFNLVKGFSQKIKNDRTSDKVYSYACDEMQELADEFALKAHNEVPGPDGIVGEAIDVISCMIDIIVLENPNFTSEDFNAYLKKKCEKWQARYHREG